MGQRRLLDVKRVATSALLMVALMGGAACASGGGGGGSSSSDEITQEDINSDHGRSNAMDLIQEMRPLWLTASRARTFVSGAEIGPVVVVDGLRFGDLASLRQINLNMVIRMRYLSAADATTLYGTGYIGGAIQIFTR